LEALIIVVAILPPGYRALHLLLPLPRNHVLGSVRVAYSGEVVIHGGVHITLVVDRSERSRAWRVDWSWLFLNLEVVVCIWLCVSSLRHLTRNSSYRLECIALAGTHLCILDLVNFLSTSLHILLSCLNLALKLVELVLVLVDHSLLGTISPGWARYLVWSTPEKRHDRVVSAFMAIPSRNSSTIRWIRALCFGRSWVSWRQVSTATTYE